VKRVSAFEARGGAIAGTNSNASKGGQNFPDPILVVYRPARLARRPLSWCRADIYARGSHLSALPRTIMAGMPEPAADKLPEQVLT
jgi:hypothetical protein